VYGAYLAWQLYQKKNVLYCCKSEFYFIMQTGEVRKSDGCPHPTVVKNSNIDLILLDHFSHLTDTDRGKIIALITECSAIPAIVIVSLGASGYYANFSQSTRVVSKFALFGWSMDELKAAAVRCNDVKTLVDHKDFLSLYLLRGGSLRALLKDIALTNPSSSMLSPPANLAEEVRRKLKDEDLPKYVCL
jgi:hypothetical protein